MDPQTTSYKTQLHAVMTARFVRTKRTWMWLFILVTILFVLTVASAFTDAPRVGPTLDGLGILCGIGVVSLRIRAQGQYGQAEALRRAYFQLEGSGIRRRDNLDVDLDRTVRAVDLGAIVHDRKYYGSSLMPGLDRLADNLEESAFYTRALAGWTWKLCLTVLVIGAGLVLALLYAAAVLGPDGSGLLTLAPHALNFIALGLALDLAVAFFRLEGSAMLTLARMETLRSGDGLRPEDLLSAINDYDCALAATGAPLPDARYAAKETDLERRWQKRCATRHPGAKIASVGIAATEEPGPSAREKLVKFLANRFDNLEFRDFVRNLGAGHLEACLVDSGVPHEAVVREFVALLERQGLVDRSLFAALEHARPARAAEIYELARLWLSAKGPHDG